MKRIVLILFFLTVFTKIHAFDENSVVKISSFHCGQKQGHFLGSGLLFNYAQENFVLTSEPVVIHSNEKSICHQISNSVPVPSLDDLNPKSNLKNLSVSAYGFPYSSWDILVHQKNAVISDPGVETGLISQVKEMVEIQGGWVEYGMSGGPVISGETNEFVGILSHQEVVSLINPFHKIDMNSSVEFSYRNPQTFFVIPARSTTDWVRSVLEKDSNFLPQIEKDTEAQVTEKKDIAYTNGLRFESVSQPLTGPVGGPEGVGRVGDGPVGCPEGVGRIGGDSDSTSDAFPAPRKVIITLAPDSKNKSWFLWDRQTGFKRAKRC